MALVGLSLRLEEHFFLHLTNETQITWPTCESTKSHFKTFSSSVLSPEPGLRQGHERCELSLLSLVLTVVMGKGTDDPIVNLVLDQPQASPKEWQLGVCGI